jgi:hypothetical protein
MPHDLSNEFEAYLLLFWVDEILDGEAVIELKEGILEEESILAMRICGQIANGLNTKYLDSHVIRCIIFIKQAFVFTFLINTVYLMLIVKLIAEVIDYVLNHHYLQLNLLTNQIDNVFECSLFIVTGFEFFML